jgi:hypothetical protein
VPAEWPQLMLGGRVRYCEALAIGLNCSRPSMEDLRRPPASRHREIVRGHFHLAAITVFPGCHQAADLRRPRVNSVDRKRARAQATALPGS